MYNTDENQQPVYESRASMVFAFVTAIGFSLACLIAGAIVCATILPK